MSCTAKRHLARNSLAQKPNAKSNVVRMNSKNSKAILLFSSDAADLYKGDIFRTLALPENHTIQFRYRRQYVIEPYRDNPRDLINERAFVFFLTGNNLQTPPEHRRLVPHPIRACKILDSCRDKNTDEVILILQLGEFTKCEIDPITDPARQPPTYFVTSANLTDIRPTNWLDRVTEVQPHFPNVLFYSLTVLSGEKTIPPTYSKELRYSQYVLQEESEYSLECTCYDPCYDPKGKRTTPLQIKVSSEDLDILNLFESGAGARQDTRRLPLVTRTLKTRSAPAFMRFQTPSGQDSDPNYIDIYWRLAQRSSKPAVFGFLTFIGVVGLLIAQGASKFKAAPSCVAVLLALGGATLVAIAAGYLFKLFNKV